MDYTDFVRNYYRISISKLNKFSHYRGSFANLNYSMNVPEEQKHFVDPNFDALPYFEINTDASVQCFENYLDYVSKNTPSLALLLLGKIGLKNFFEEYNLHEQDETKALVQEMFSDFLLN